MKNPRLKTYAFLIFALYLAAPGANTALAQNTNSLVEISDAWVRPPTKDGGPATAYFTIFNKSHDADYLIHVASPVAERATLQRMRIRNFQAVYDTISKLSIDAIDRVRLRPGDYQVTLEQVTKPLRVGQDILLTLTFERAGRVEVSARVTNQLLGNR